MEESVIPAIVLVTLLSAMLVSGVPIAFVLCSVGLIGCLVWIGAGSTIQMVQFFLSQTSSDVLVCLPLFLFMAEIISVADIGKGVFNAAKVWAGRFRGGVGFMALIGCALFGAISGSSTANIAAVGTIALWEMVGIGYSRTLACGIVGTGGMLDVLIPPSIVMIIYGAITDQSIGELFIAGVIPGIILTIFCLLTIVVWCYLDPKAAPIPAEKLPLKVKLRATTSILPFVIIFIAMFWSFYTGVATPTEVAVVGVLASVIIGVCNRRLTLRKIFEASRKAGLSTTFILFIIAGAKFFTFVVTGTGISFIFTKWMGNLGLSPMHLIIVLMIVYLVLGAFIDAAGAMTLTLPFILPLLVSAHIDLIWFGILITVNLELGYVTPPFGLNLFILKGVAPPGTTMKNIIGGNVPFYVASLVMLGLIIGFPWLATWLPSRM